MSTIRPHLNDVIRDVAAQNDGAEPTQLVDLVMNQCSLDTSFYLRQALAGGVVTKVLAESRRSAFQAVLPNPHEDVVRAAQNFTVVHGANESQSWPGDREPFPATKPVAKFHSAKRQLIVGEWETFLGSSFRTSQGEYISMGDATARDLRDAAEMRRKMSSELEREASRYDLIAGILDEKGVKHLREIVPDEAVQAAVIA